jgi:hypothetical protein
MSKSSNHTDIILFWFFAIVIIGGAFIALRQPGKTPSATSTSTSAGELKVIDQAQSTGPSTGAGSVLQPSVISNSATDTTPACNRAGSNQQQVQGGACNNQDQVKQLLNQ